MRPTYFWRIVFVCGLAAISWYAGMPREPKPVPETSKRHFVSSDKPYCDFERYTYMEDQRCRELATKLISAAGDGDLDAMRDAFRNGVRADDIIDGDSALMAAIRNGQRNAVVLLINDYAHIERNYFQKHSPMIAAILFEKPEIVKVLIEGGAGVCGYDGPENKLRENSPLAIARKKNNVEIIALLEKAGRRTVNIDPNYSFSTSNC